MSVIATDKIAPRTATRTIVEGAVFPDSIAFNYGMMRSYLLDSETHRYTLEYLSQSLTGGQAGATMLAAMQLIGNVVTLAWESFAFVGNDNVLLSLLPEESLLIGDGTATATICYTRNGTVSHGRIVAAGPDMAVYSGDARNVFTAGESIVVQSGSITWPFVRRD